MTAVEVGSEALSVYGYDKELYAMWQTIATPKTSLGRVIADFGTSLKVALPRIIIAELAGKLAHYAKKDDLVPKVGDWVSVHVPDQGNAIIEAVVPRRNEIARKAPGNRTAKQVIAANIHVAFIVLALDDDFSIERLKRFLYQLSINNIATIIVLNKADKANDNGGVTRYQQQLQSFKQPVIISNALTNSGVDKIREYIKPGKTAVLLGSSGVGKSTLTNQLLGRDTQDTQSVRLSDSSGKHTTVHRELFILPNGGLLIDMPGIRELQLWGTPDELDDEYADIATLISHCKYASCQHHHESGCAVQLALQSGKLNDSRYASYQKFQQELSILQAKQIVLRRLDNKRTPKKLRQQAKDSFNGIRYEIDEMSN